MTRGTPCRRDGCSATITFVKLDGGGAMPVDPVPDPTGNVAATKGLDGRLHGHVLSQARPLQPGQTVYMAHYATCAAKPRPRRTPPLFEIPEETHA